MADNIFKQNILVTGGTGSFGQAFVRKVLAEHDPLSVVVFSRDEDKQHAMRKAFNNPIIKFEIGDVRDRDRVFQVMYDHDIDLVFHAAALKQVPAGEFFPLEVVKTNILGTTNVVDAAIHYSVDKVVGLSTDKAAYPINAMGMSKALMEKVLLSKARTSAYTKICITRYGNVMCSRGSIIPIWIKAAKEGRPLTVTVPDMTRFLMSLDSAIDLVLYALNEGQNGDLLVKKAPACTMERLAWAVNDIFSNEPKIEIIGVRHGEKMHETLLTAEEMIRAEDKGDYYIVHPDVRGLDYDSYFSEGKQSIMPESFTSFNAMQLDDLDVRALLMSLKEVQRELNN